MTVIKKNNTITVEDRKLSIQFNLDGFSFCITNNITKEIIHFSEYIFKEKQSAPEKLLEEITKIFKTDVHLQSDFSSVLVVHQNDLFTLVPDAYFLKEKVLEYLNFNIKTLATDFIAVDDLHQVKAKNVYIPYVNINNYLFQNFGEFEYKHHLTLLIEKLTALPSSEDKKVYINVSKGSFDLVVIQKQQLIFSNCFSFDTKEDFMYYILFTLEQLKLATDEIALYFTGAIEEDSGIYKIAYKYIKNIFFLKSDNKIFNRLNIAKHSNYILLGA